MGNLPSSALQAVLDVLLRYVLVNQDKKEWGLVRRGVAVSNCSQRTFLSLMLIGVVVFGVHFESDWDYNGFKCTIFLRLLELGVCLVLLPDSTTRHLRVVIYYYRSISLQWSIASLVKRPFYFWDEDTVEQNERQKLDQVVVHQP